MRANPDVFDFFSCVASTGDPVDLSVNTIGEPSRGVEVIWLRGDADQTGSLEHALSVVLERNAHKVLSFHANTAQVWGGLLVPSPEQALDKKIAATALVHDLSVVTRNSADFAGAGVKVMNPFVAPAPPQ